VTYIRTQAGFMQLQDSARLLRAVFPNCPELRPCSPVPVLVAAPVYPQAYNEGYLLTS
jgi:hypothetical protein